MTTDTEPVPPSSLFNRNFLLLWQGQLVSQLGTQAFLVAVMYWTMENTASGSLMGVMMMLSALPALFVGPIAGAFADRYRRRSIIIVCDLVSGFTVLSLAGAMFLLNPSTSFMVWLIGIMVLSTSISSTFFQPAVTAAIPDIVPSNRLNQANSWYYGANRVSYLAGQGAGGVLYALVGAPWLFLINGLSYLFSAMSEAWISIPDHRKTGISNERIGIWKATKEGLEHVRQRKGMLYLLLSVTLVNFFLAPSLVVLPFYVDLTLQQGVEWYGILLASFSFGGLLGAIAISLPAFIRHRPTLFTTAMFLFCGLFILLGQVQNVWIAIIVLVGAGCTTGIIGTSLPTVIQARTPTEIRGRVMAVAMMFGATVGPIGFALGGLLIDLTNRNVPMILAWCGSLGIASLLPLMFRASVQEFLASSPSQEPETSRPA